MGIGEVEVDAQHLTAARYKIEDLLRLVQQGRVRIPRFQRPLRWTGTDVERLFDSIYRGFPVGTLLFWIKDADKEVVRLGPVTIEAPQLTDASWVVDGHELGSLPPSFERLRESRVYVIDRFDREAGRQIHIEDLNQVVGNWPENKYRGLSYEGLGRLLLEICGDQDFWEYLRRLVFNIAVGNEDSHLKNWSLIYPDRANPRLAPLYDVVSTVVIPGFTRESALKLGGKRRPQTFDVEAVVRVAAKAGASAEEARAVVDAMLERIRAAEPALRPQPWLTTDEWATLDAYRGSVPLLRPLVA